MSNMWPLVLVAVALCSAPTGVFLQDSSLKCKIEIDGDYECNSNYLATVPEGVPGNVTIVYLDINNLTSLGNKELLTKGYANIEGLYIRHNHITELDDEAFSGLTNLSVVSLFANNITVFSKDIFSSNLNMKDLHLGDNPIKLPDSEETPLLSSASLRMLSLFNCGLTRVTDGLFSELPNLKLLDLTENRLTTINWRSVNHLNKLTQFMLQGNAIRHFTCNPEIMPSVSELGDGLPDSHYLPGQFNGTSKVLYLLNNPIECDCCLALMKYGLRKMSWHIHVRCQESTGHLLESPTQWKQCYNTTMEEYNNFAGSS